MVSTDIQGESQKSHTFSQGQIFRRISSEFSLLKRSIEYCPFQFLTLELNLSRHFFFNIFDRV